MKIKSILSNEKFKILTDNAGEDKEVKGCFVGDMLSIVMSKAKEGNIWVTIQGHLNIVAVAELTGVAGIIVAGATEVQEDAVSKANEEGIVIISTDMSTYETVKELIKLNIE